MESGGGNTVMDVYLQEEHFNTTANSRIPGAWVAVINIGYLGEVTQPFAYPDEFDNADEARKKAESLFN